MRTGAEKTARGGKKNDRRGSPCVARRRGQRLRFSRDVVAFGEVVIFAGRERC